MYRSQDAIAVSNEEILWLSGVTGSCLSWISNVETGFEVPKTTADLA